MNKPPQIFKPEDFVCECELWKDRKDRQHGSATSSGSGCEAIESARLAQAIFEKWWEQYLIEYEHAKVYFYKTPKRGRRRMNFLCLFRHKWAPECGFYAGGTYFNYHFCLKCGILRISERVLKF